MYSLSLHSKETGISSDLMGHLACMQTLPCLWQAMKHTYQLSSPLFFLSFASCKCLLTAFVNEPALSFLKSAATAWKAT